MTEILLLSIFVFLEFTIVKQTFFPLVQLSHKRLLINIASSLTSFQGNTKTREIFCFSTKLYNGSATLCLRFQFLSLYGFFGP